MLNAEIDPDLPDKVQLSGPFRFNDLIKTVPGAKFGSRRGPNGERLPQAWRAPLTWQLCLALRTTFGQELEMGEKLRAWAWEYRNNIVNPALELRMKTELDLPGYEHLFGYQRAGVKFMATTKRALLADSMGAGKTVTGISTLRYLHEQGEEVFPSLIVAPSSTLLSWEREIHKWWPGTEVTVLRGTSTQRRKKFQQFMDQETECALHSATQKKNTMLLDPVGTAMKSTSANGIQNLPRDSGRTQEIGTTPNQQRLTPADSSRITSIGDSEFLEKSTTPGSSVQTTHASSAPGKPSVLTTTTTLGESEGSSVEPATLHSPEETKTLAGSTEQNCTCAKRFLVINWEGLRFHSRLAPYGNVALKICEECGGEDPKVKSATCQKHKKELNAIDFKSAIGDEIHRAKTGSAASTRALKAATANTPIKIAMSGTPIANNHGDLWSPLNWLLPESYPSKTAFVERFMDMSYNPWGGQEIIGLKQHMEPEFFAGVDPHLRHMPKDFVLSHLPPKVYERRDVEMGAKQAKAYKQMAEDMISELSDDDVLRATDPLQKATRLLQLASTYGTVESYTEMVLNEETGGMEPKLRQKLILEDPSCKLDAFMDDLDDFGDESIVVFTVARQLAELLSKRLDKKGINHGLLYGGISDADRQRHMDDFQEGKTKIILVTVQAGGTGVTLTAGSIAVFLQRPHSLVNSKQAEDRVHRIGSEVHDVVRYIDYVTKDTIEETIFPALEMKDGYLEKILRSKEALRTMLIDKMLPEDTE